MHRYIARLGWLGHATAFLCVMTTLPIPRSQAAETPANITAQRLLLALEYIDFPDLLVSIAAQDANPWERYDEGERYWGRSTPLETRWNQAIRVVPNGSIIEHLSAIHDIFIEASGLGLRETPLDDSGGSFDRADDGMGGFDRVTASEASVLRANPLLSVEIIPDHYNVTHPGQTFLARYRYPSAGTYRQFEQYLTQALVYDLRAAENAGQLDYDPRFPQNVTPQFRWLTRRIVTELLTASFNPTRSAASNYRSLLAVQPFADYNRRTLRAWFRHQHGRPVFLPNFTCDLYCTGREFNAAVELGDRQIELISADLVKAEKQNATYPRFYNAPAFWLIAGARESKANSLKMNDSFVALSKGWFLRPENTGRIRQKLFLEIYGDFRAHLDAMGF